MRKPLTTEEKLVICEEDRKRLYAINFDLDHIRMKTKYMQRLASLHRIIPGKEYDAHFKDMVDVLDSYDTALFVLERDMYDLKQKLKEKENGQNCNCV